MHPPGLFQILVIALIIVVLFGRGRISRSMGELGEGVRAVRKRIDEDDATPLPAEGPVADTVREPQSTADN